MLLSPRYAGPTILMIGTADVAGGRGRPPRDGQQLLAHLGRSAGRSHPESLTLRAPMPSSTPSAWTHLLAGLATAFDSPI